MCYKIYEIKQKLGLWASILRAASSFSATPYVQINSLKEPSCSSF